MSDLKEKIEKSNRKTVEIMMSGQPVWIGDGKAIDVIPGMTENTILHAGPPIEWDRMCNPMRQGILGAAIFEKFATNLSEAKEMVEEGEIILAPCHDFFAVGGMTGVTSASMPVHIVKNETFGNMAYCLPHEGSTFKAIGWGTCDEETIQQVRWMAEELSPVLNAGVQAIGGINIREVIARAIQMGDEAHSRCTAATLLITRRLAPYLVRLDLDGEILNRVFQFLQATDIFALHIIMASARSIIDPAKNIPYSTIVTALARNGVDFGIKVSAMGENWFIGPAQKIRTVYFSPEWDDLVATPDIGDSSIMEVVGLGGLIHVAAPAHEHLLGGTYADAIRKTEEAYSICVGEHETWRIPSLDLRGVPIGIDIRKVVKTGITPTIDTATPHVEGGFIGSGETNPPLEAFEKALRAFGELVEVST